MATPSPCPPLQHPAMSGLLSPPSPVPSGGFAYRCPCLVQLRSGGGAQKHRWCDNGHLEMGLILLLPPQSCCLVPMPVGDRGLWRVGPLGSPWCTISCPWSLVTLSGCLSLSSSSVIGLQGCVRRNWALCLLEVDRWASLQPQEDPQTQAVLSQKSPVKTFGAPSKQGGAQPGRPPCIWSVLLDPAISCEQLSCKEG